jgi:hypothetical protein
MMTPSRASDAERGAGERAAGPAARAEEVIVFVQGRSVPCPKCGYELRDLQQAQCPECGEELELRVGSARPKFGWLVLAMAPGCFSGVTAVMMTVPIFMTLRSYVPGAKKGVPIPLMGAWVFGILSAASIVLLYRARHRIMAMPTLRQATLAGCVWGIHILAFVAMLVALRFWP